MYVVKGHDLAVGFTQRQAQRVRAARELPGVPPTVKVLPFAYVPAHPLVELIKLKSRIWKAAQHNISIRRRIVGVGVEVRDNVVDVGAARGQVKRLAGLLREEVGSSAPIHVHYEEAPVEMSGSS